MKRRLQFMLGLIAIAITISMIAVTVGWYSAEAGIINMKGTEATITTADNNYYGGSTKLTCQGILEYNDGVYSLKEYEAYLGQLGLVEETYILLFSATEEIHSVSRSGFVDSCTITKPEEVTFTYTKETSPFKVVLLTIGNDGKSFAEAKSGETFSYIAVIFGDGTNRFPFSYSENKGTSFNLNIYLEN